MEPPQKIIKLDPTIQSKATFHDLPEEMIDEILSYCSIKDILKLSEVNKFWNSIIKTSQKYMKEITLTVTEKNYKEVINCTRLYKKVRVNSKPPLRCEPLKAALKYQFESICDIELPIINLIGIKFPNLRNLHVINSMDYFTDENLDERDFYFTKPRRDSKKRLVKDAKTIFNHFASQLEVIHLSSTLDSPEVFVACQILKKLKFLKLTLIDQESIEDENRIFEINISDDFFYSDYMRYLSTLKIHNITYDYAKDIMKFKCSSYNNRTILDALDHA